MIINSIGKVNKNCKKVKSMPIFIGFAVLMLICWLGKNMYKNNIKKSYNNKNKSKLIIIYLLIFIILSVVYWKSVSNKSISINGNLNNSELYGFNGKAYINTNKFDFLRGRIVNNNNIVVKINGKRYEVEANKLEIICDSVSYNDKEYASTPHQIEVKDSTFIITPPFYNRENHFHATKIDISRNNNIDYEFLGNGIEFDVQLDDISSNVQIPNNKEIKISGVNTDIIINNKNVNNRLDYVTLSIESEYTYSDFTIESMDEVKFELFDYSIHFDGTITEMVGKLDSTESKILINSRAGQKEYKVDNNSVECYGKLNIDLYCDNNRADITLFGNITTAKIGSVILNSDIFQFIVENYVAIIITLLGVFIGFLLNT